MKLVKIFLCGAMFLFTIIGLALAQDPLEAGAVNQELKDSSDMQWVWGEVVNIDSKNNEVILKYLDYEDNQEKEIAITIDSGTVYDNIKSLEELKPHDSLSVDYMINKDGKNVAKNIGLDKPKESQPQVQPAETVGQVETQAIETGK